MLLAGAARNEVKKLGMILFVIRSQMSARMFVSLGFGFADANRLPSGNERGLAITSRKSSGWCGRKRSGLHGLHVFRPELCSAFSLDGLGAAGPDNGCSRMKAKREGSSPKGLRQTFRYFAATAWQGEREREPRRRRRRAEG
jgi:hypothetical protein